MYRDCDLIFIYMHKNWRFSYRKKFQFINNLKCCIYWFSIIALIYFKSTFFTYRTRRNKNNEIGKLRHETKKNVNEINYRYRLSESVDSKKCVICYNVFYFSEFFRVRTQRNAHKRILTFKIVSIYSSALRFC